MRSTLLHGCAIALGLAAAGGCGGGDSNRADGGADSGGDVDAGPPVTTQVATIAVADVRVESFPELGTGGQIAIRMVPSAGEAAALVHDDRDRASGMGCAAWVQDLADPLPGEDHGAVTIGDTTATVPGCLFAAGSYRCVARSGQGAVADILTPVGNGVIEMTVAGGSFAAADAGRWIEIAGSVHFRNNGRFPVIAAPSATTVRYLAPASLTQSGLTGLTYTVLAGAGPVPGGGPLPPSPEFIADSDQVVVALEAPAGDAFEADPTAVLAAGDDFALSAAAAAQIWQVPVDGSPFTLDCDPGACGTAEATAIIVDFNDGGEYRVVADGAGAGPTITDDVTDTDCTIASNGDFIAGLAALSPGEMTIVVSGSVNPFNDGTFEVIRSNWDSITYANAACASDGFGAATAYQVRQRLAAHELPEPATSGATRAGRIICVESGGTSVTVVAGAAAALQTVNPARIRTTVLRAGFRRVVDADGLNPVDVWAGHGIIGITP